MGDLLAHRYRPNCVDEFRCHPEEAARLKQWILNYINQKSIHSSNSNNNDNSSSSSDYSFGEDSNLDAQHFPTRCVLITGPPGVGKTSLVYTIANELKLHVVESHSSEKRDAKTLGMLRLTNQKCKINPIAKMFQNAQQNLQQRQDTSQRRHSRKKRRKLSDSSSVINITTNQSLSLSGDTSIVLFDDIDVTFEEDGPFLKSLANFISESKRPVVLTATKSIDSVKEALVYFEHIHLSEPNLEDCSKLLRDICKKERHHNLSKTSRCRAIAEQLDCDIRQCLNRIDFFKEGADQQVDSLQIFPELSKLDLSGGVDDDPLLRCYSTISLTDHMNACFNLSDRITMRERWLKGTPSIRDDRDTGYENDLGEQIFESIVDSSRNLYKNELMRPEDVYGHRRDFKRVKGKFQQTADLTDQKINSRVEPPDREFYIDIVPYFSEITALESQTCRSGRRPGLRNKLDPLESLSFR